MASSAANDVLIDSAEVGKVFRDFWGRPRVTAVRQVTFQVTRGTVCGLLGPNGAGKSTLMKLLLGHLYPTTGRLSVFGRPPTDVASKARLGYLPERAYLYKNLSPVETLRFFGEVLELPAPEIRSRTDQLLAMVGLEQSRHRLVGEFSHGMMRRMGLAQALLNDPDLLLLDEPTAGLDPLGCREVKNLLLTLARRGKTIILTSHLLGDVEDVCDQLLIMYGGRVLAHGPTRQLLADHDQLQVRLPAPSAEALTRLTELLATVVPREQLEFSSPTRSLESYFLEVVRQASTQHETAGARAGAGVASYLRAGVTESPDVLEALTHARTAPPPPAAAPAPPAVDAAALAGLTQAAPPAPPPTAAKPAVNQQLLDDLTKGSK